MEQSIRDIWWKENSVRAVFWLVFVLLCKCVEVGEGKGQRQASGKTGEFWREMRGWGSCSWGGTLERYSKRGEFRRNYSMKGWYNRFLQLPKKISLKTPLFINALWCSIVFSGDLHTGIRERGQGWVKRWQKALWHSGYKNDYTEKKKW